VANGPTASSFGASSNAAADQSTAIGYGSTAVAAGSTAIGYGSRANNANDVALGSGSVTGAANPTSSAMINSTTYTGFAGNNPKSVVSVGSVGNERQITNVAAGRITSTSTDAVNGSQIYSIADMLSRNMSAGIASAMSIGSIPTPTEPGALVIGGGVGVWRGQAGYSLGIGKATADGRFVFKITGTVDSQGEKGATAGFGIQF
jgi:autotransporter adhesin